MKRLNLNHSLVNTLDNYCSSSLQITNNYSNIKTLNIFNSLSSFFGKYNCNINIYNSTYLYLKDSFTLNHKSICLFGNNSSPLDITIDGNLNTTNPYLNISSIGNVNFTSKLMSRNTTIKILLNDKTNCSSSFLVNSDFYTTPIIICCKNYSELTINSHIKFIDFTCCKNIDFTIIPNKTILKFINVNKNTFKFLNASLESIMNLKNQYPNIKFRIRSLLFNNALVDGKEVIIVPKNICKPKGISVLIGNNEYPIKFS